ncbi:MAG: polysaccharide biosynthesis C-terminal domain-containing protein [Balneolaceae bacterium]
MGIIIRQSIQNTILSYTGILLGFISTILLFPNILNADQYGLTRVLLSVAIICAQFSHLGMNNIVIRFFPYYQKSDNSRHRLLTLALSVPMAGFLLFLVLFFAFRDVLISYYSDQSGLMAEYDLYLLPLVFAVLFFEVLNSYVRSLKDSVTGSFVNEVLVRILIITLLVVYSFGWLTFREFMILFVSSYLIQPVCMLIYLARNRQLAFSLPFQKETRRLFKGMSVYGAYSVLGGLATLLVGNIDIIMLGALTDLGSTAVYAIAFYVGSVIAVPQRSIGKIASPILADMLKAKEFEEIDSLYKRTALNQLLAGSLLFVGIWANMHNITALLPEEYDGIYWVVVIIGLAKLFNMATGVNGMIIINSKHYRFDLYTNILLVILTIVTNLLLIPPYGITGAAIATAISIFVYNFIKFLFVWIKFRMQPFQWNALGVLGIAVLSLTLSSMIPYLNNFFVDVTIRSLAIAGIFLTAVLVFHLSEDAKNLVTETWKRIRSFLKA